ncbi:MAG: hypothetical protein JRN26_00915 [Nitrososphaerota archaeon]|jgi:hypothetical protein|nr:hypothetical protein [Nitrososphaerota archaeon]MDG6928234.1 hypothetical protein [Nitrososphaerota archaeon]MDG6930728.1 hypothetical protein [Nitrososphaerota archaeon]MDG6931836.1 hypothetical protein [Nitrososphaerota archaeon]MDG6935440.1 hypothetical protein [Nitrososphaerota archaeon]
MDSKIVGVGAIAIFLVAMVAVLGTGEIPAPPGTGTQVANVIVSVDGTWNGYLNIPFETATVSITQITPSITDYHNVLYSVITTSGGQQLSTADTSKAKIEYTLVADGETQASGTVYFTLSSNWNVQYIIKNVPVGTYTLTVIVFEYWTNGILGSGWSQRTSSETTVTVNPSSSSG